MSGDIYKTNFLQELSKTNWEIISGTINPKSPVEVKCNLCNNIQKFKQLRFFKKNYKCKCMSPNLDDFVLFVNKNNFTIIDELKSLYKPVSIKCNNCGFIKNLRHPKTFYEHYTCKKCYVDQELHNKYINQIILNNFEIISYTGKQLFLDTPITIKCINCNTIKHLKQLKNAIKNKCRDCVKQAKYTIDDVILMCSKYGIKYLDKKFINVRQYQNFECDKGHKMYKPFSEFIRSFKNGTNGCKMCGIENLRLQPNYIKQEYISLGFEFLDDMYRSAKTKHTTKCLSCGNIWKTTPSCILHIKSGCPHCNALLNEKLTGKYLRELLPNIAIEHNKYINTSNLSNQRYVFVDYYFKINQQAYIVEYNGIQHYKPVKFSESQYDFMEKFEKQKLRDQWLRDYCSNNNIILIEIDGRKYKKNDILNYLESQLIQQQVL